MDKRLPTTGNPCSFDSNERLAAKIWELLRRNRAFRSAVDRQARLDKMAIGHPRRSEAQYKRKRHFNRVSIRHGFAATALQWLLPEPLFIWHREKGDGRIGYATQPCRPRSKKWQWVRVEREGMEPPPFRRGPLIEWYDSDSINPIAEWNSYEKNHGTFSVDHDWSSSPPGFRRDFAFQVRTMLDSEPTNSSTGDRSDAPRPHEVKLGEFNDEVALRLALRDLVRNYRLVAIPKTLLSQRSVDSAFDVIKREFRRGLPRRKRDWLGTATQWQNFLEFETLTAGGCTRAQAMRTLIERNHAKLPLEALAANANSQGRPIDLRKKADIITRARQAHEGGVDARIRYIEKLRGLTFPQFDFSALLEPQQRGRSAK